MENILRGQLTGDYRQDFEAIALSMLSMMLLRRREILTSLSEAERLPEMRELIAFIPRQLRQMLVNRNHFPRAYPGG